MSPVAGDCIEYARNPNTNEDGGFGAGVGVICRPTTDKDADIATGPEGSLRATASDIGGCEQAGTF